MYTECHTYLVTCSNDSKLTSKALGGSEHNPSQNQTNPQPGVLPVRLILSQQLNIYYTPGLCLTHSMPLRPSSSNMTLSDHIFPSYPWIPLSMGFSYYQALHTIVVTTPRPVHAPLAWYTNFTISCCPSVSNTLPIILSMPKNPKALAVGKPRTCGILGVDSWCHRCSA